MNRNLRSLKGKIVGEFLSQRAFARELGIPESRVSQVVRGHWRLSPEEKSEWARKLGEEEAKLFPLS